LSVSKNHVIPAQAGIQIMKKFSQQCDNTFFVRFAAILFNWIPAYAGMTA